MRKQLQGIALILFAILMMIGYGNATFADWYLSNIPEYYSSDEAYLMGNYATDTYSKYSLNLSEVSRLTLRQNEAKINILLYYLNGNIVTDGSLGTGYKVNITVGEEKKELEEIEEQNKSLEKFKAVAQSQ